MRTIYLRVTQNGLTRKVAIDLAFLAKHNIIRFPKYYFEEGLYLPFKDLKNSQQVENYYLTKDKIFKEDKDFYYFKFPFKMEQVAGTAI